MADGRVTWTRSEHPLSEGTSPAHHYTAHLGTLSADEPLTATAHTFPNLTPGDYPSSVDTVAVDGSVLATHQGNILHVPTPVVIPVAMQVTSGAGAPSGRQPEAIQHDFLAGVELTTRRSIGWCSGKARCSPSRWMSGPSWSIPAGRMR